MSPVPFSHFYAQLHKNFRCYSMKSCREITKKRIEKEILVHQVLNIGDSDLKLYICIHADKS